jgi:hypothetical protein
LKELGWYRGPGVITALGMSFDTWADMTHTVPVERRGRSGEEKSEEPRSIAYFCGVMAEEDIDRDEPRRTVVEDLHRLLGDEIAPAWPAAFKDHETALDFVAYPHVQANVVGSDRYTLSLPGSIDDRISPLDRSVANMTIAGDWTACGLDAGCIEAAVMSGMLAAHAISGAPDLESIIGYDHP